MKIFLLLFTLCITIPAFSQPDIITKPEGKHFVMAPSGLNLREGPTRADQKIGKVPYGATVEILMQAKESKMLVDNIPGGMAMVRYGDTIGYVFDGYLSAFPPPIDIDDTEAYAELVRDQGNECLYEIIRKDWGGYIQHEEAVTLDVYNWSEAYLLAQQLYNISEGLQFPGETGPTEESFENPDKPEYAWTDMLSVERSEEGNLISIHYSYRAEGGGQAVIIQLGKDADGLRISQLLIAD